MRKTAYLFCLLVFTCIHHLYAEKRLFTREADSSLILIPFEFQQSALYHSFTYEVIDSVAAILLKNEKITLSIRGFAHADEGPDSVCKWLSEDRALFVKKYIMGRGVEEGRIAFTAGMGAERSQHNNTDKNNRVLYFRAELVLNYPPPPPPIIADRDEDGILNEADGCPDAFGYIDNKGCPDSNAFIIPFGSKEDWLAAFTYHKLDTLVKILRQYPAYTISIQGHAYKTEGNDFLCSQLAANRAAIVKRYLRSRNIEEKKNFSGGRFWQQPAIKCRKKPGS